MEIILNDENPGHKKAPYYYGFHGDGFIIPILVLEVNSHLLIT